jgi:hypothetical protein
MKVDLEVDLSAGTSWLDLQKLNIPMPAPRGTPA